MTQESLVNELNEFKNELNVQLIECIRKEKYDLLLHRVSHGIERIDELNDAIKTVGKDLLITIVSDFQVHGRGDIKTYYLDAAAITKDNEYRYVGTFSYYRYLSSNRSSDSAISKKGLREDMRDDFRRGAAISVEKTPARWEFSFIEEKFDWLQRQGYSFSPLNISHYREIVMMIAEIEAEQSDN